MSKLDLGDISAIGVMIYVLGSVLATTSTDVIFCLISVVFWLVVFLVSSYKGV